ncbi:MAG: hypothetical protein LBL86_01220 [Coriobacteriales bacterium]|jgi:hypothetical protein|nr:hypothetical protein [Coriobacteriales bacterium]
METYRYIHAKSSWMSAREALQLAEKLAEMGAEDGNIDSYMRQGVYGDYLQQAEELEYGTSDFIATVPLMYMVTHGVDLILKGYMYAGHPQEAPQAPPKLADMLERFRAEFADETVVSEFIDTYIDPDKLPQLFAVYLREVGKDLDDLYKERRFLNNASFYRIIEQYKPYVYTWEDGKRFYQEVLEDLRSVLPVIEALQADIDSEGVPGDKVKALRR